ncbi:hypothetical protein [Legionella sp. 16cNR16C]|uniref:hypothetical protein n=1 Tax=Legionella sp. 16cNR16C TaxID=2905656 RepID=UPI001E485446|nr:hypothetical protein [Legionella sp. 16cNR16C]MCE3045370.1 hypothetical protein [Legionella sp. 16cNR16C]
MDSQLTQSNSKAISFQLNEGTGGITGMCPCGAFLEMYKIDKTFRIQSNQNIEPQDDDLWITTPTSDVGTGNRIVARTLLQNHEILKAAWFEKKINKEAVTIALHTCKEELLNCEKIAMKIQAQVNSIVNDIEISGLQLEKNGRGYNPFPHVVDLESNCGNFLMHAKKVIKNISALPHYFIEGCRLHSNFKILANEFKTTLGKEHLLTKFTQMNNEIVVKIMSLRNFFEHPEDKKTHIENFKLHSKHIIVVPQWYVTGEQPRSITEDMNGIVNFLFHLCETFFIHLVMVSLKKGTPYILREIQKSERNPEAPIKYNLSLSLCVNMNEYK